MISRLLITYAKTFENKVSFTGSGWMPPLWGYHSNHFTDHTLHPRMKNTFRIISHLINFTIALENREEWGRKGSTRRLGANLLRVGELEIY